MLSHSQCGLEGTGNRDVLVGHRGKQRITDRFGNLGTGEVDINVD